MIMQGRQEEKGGGRKDKKGREGSCSERYLPPYELLNTILIAFEDRKVLGKRMAKAERRRSTNQTRGNEERERPLCLRHSILAQAGSSGTQTLR